MFYLRLHQKCMFRSYDYNETTVASGISIVFSWSLDRQSHCTFYDKLIVKQLVLRESKSTIKSGI